MDNANNREEDSSPLNGLNLEVPPHGRRTSYPSYSTSDGHRPGSDYGQAYIGSHLGLQQSFSSQGVPASTIAYPSSLHGNHELMQQVPSWYPSQQHPQQQQQQQHNPQQHLYHHEPQQQHQNQLPIPHSQRLRHNSSQAVSFGVPSFGTSSPGYTQTGVRTPSSTAFSTYPQYTAGDRQPPQTPDTNHTAFFNGTDNSFIGMGGALTSPHPHDTSRIAACTAPLTTFDDVPISDWLPSPTTPEQFQGRISSLPYQFTHADRLQLPTRTLLGARRPSCSTIDSGNSYYTNDRMPGNSSSSHWHSPLPTTANPVSHVRGAPTMPANPASLMNTFTANTRGKRRGTDMDADAAPPIRRQKRDHTKRACISCYLNRKKCGDGIPCHNCLAAVAGQPGGDTADASLGIAPQCVSSLFTNQNVFLHCLPDELKERVDELTGHKDWKKTSADKLLNIDLQLALETLSMKKLGHRRGFEQSVQQSPELENDLVFGPFYKACVILQSRAALRSHTEGTFRYTADFEDSLLVLRAATASRVFHMVESRMEKNKIGDTVRPGSRRACVLTTILGMLLEQTLGFHNSLSPTVTPDEKLQETTRQLAYHLAYRLVFMAKRALKDSDPGVENYVQIGMTLSDVKVDEQLWTAIIEAHNAHDHSPVQDGSVSAHTGNSYLRTGQGTDAGVSPEQADQPPGRYHRRTEDPAEFDDTRDAYESRELAQLMVNLSMEDERIAQMTMDDHFDYTPDNPGSDINRWDPFTPGAVEAPTIYHDFADFDADTDGFLSPIVPPPDINYGRAEFTAVGDFMSSIFRESGDDTRNISTSIGSPSDVFNPGYHPQADDAAFMEEVWEASRQNEAYNFDYQNDFDDMHAGSRA